MTLNVELNLSAVVIACAELPFLKTWSATSEKVTLLRRPAQWWAISATGLCQANKTRNVQKMEFSADSIICTSNPTSLEKSCQHSTTRGSCRGAQRQQHKTMVWSTIQVLIPIRKITVRAALNVGAKHAFHHPWETLASWWSARLSRHRLMHRSY